MGPIGIPEMMGIFVIALLLFGPKKLPELGRMLAKGLTEFRRAKNELKTTFETHLRDLERETNLESTFTPPPSITSAPSYPYTYDEYGHGDTAELPAATTESAPALNAAPVRQIEASATPVEGTIARTNGIGHVDPHASDSHSTDVHATDMHGADMHATQAPEEHPA
jgi:TatA/E family protein of Tat protein translocase